MSSDQLLKSNQLGTASVLRRMYMLLFGACSENITSFYVSKCINLFISLFVYSVKPLHILPNLCIVWPIGLLTNVFYISFVISIIFSPFIVSFICIAVCPHMSQSSAICPIISYAHPSVCLSVPVIICLFLAFLPLLVNYTNHGMTGDVILPHNIRPSSFKAID